MKKHVLLDSLGDHLNFCSFLNGHPPNQEMGVISPEVVKEHRDFVQLPKHEITPLMSCTTELSCEMIVIPHFLKAIGLGEWLFADVTLLSLIEFSPVIICECDDAFLLEE